MIPGQARRARTVAVVVVSIAFAVSAHFAIVEGLPPHLGALLSLVPVTMLGLWFVRRSPRRLAALAAAAIAAAAAWLAFPSLEAHVPRLFFAEHAGGQLVLAFLFGRTLAAGREPLCARFARIIHGTLPADVAGYCRAVTIAWTVFFSLVFALSCALYLGGLLAAWSFFANILTPLLVAAMFVVEYVVRCRVLPHWERVGVLGAFQAFSRHFGAAQPQSPR